MVTRTTAADRDLLAFEDFRIVPILLGREAPERLAEAGQLKRDNPRRGSWVVRRSRRRLLQG
jgi:hypothetical protein